VERVERVGEKELVCGQESGSQYFEPRLWVQREPERSLPSPYLRLPFTHTHTYRLSPTHASSHTSYTPPPPFALSEPSPNLLRAFSEPLSASSTPRPPHLFPAPAAQTRLPRSPF
jgi:hypothetical protein